MYKDQNYYTHRNTLIVQEYLTLPTTVEKIAAKYSITARQLQRIIKERGFSRTIAEANKLSAKYKNYEGHKSPHKVVRKTLPRNLRYKMISEHPYCSTCGSFPNQCPLQIDHIDGNSRNNDLSNLQVLCMDCNYGKK